MNAVLFIIVLTAFALYCSVQCAIVLLNQYDDDDDAIWVSVFDCHLLAVLKVVSEKCRVSPP